MNKITADRIGSSFARDPELRLPRYPRFPSEILLVPHGASGILFEGGAGTELISGAGARAFLPRLIRVLDGRRGLDDLMALFPTVAPAKLTGAIALLYSRGLLEDGPGPGAAETHAAQGPQAGFFGRYVDSTRVNKNREAALARMRDAHVVIAGGRAAPLLAEALAGSGLGRVERPDSPGRLAAGADLLVTLFTPGEEAAASAWLDRAWDLGLRVLHHAAGASHVELGPLFVPGASASPECFRRIHAAWPEGEAEDLSLWAAIAAMNVQNVISRVGRMTLFNCCHLHRRHPGEVPSHEEIRLARMPGSRAAGLGHVAEAPRMDPGHLVWQLHNSANGMPPRDYLSPRDYQMHYSASNIKTAAERPDPYFGAPSLTLPEGLSLPRAGASLDLAALAGLLRFAAGHDGQRRIAPSAGGLGCVNLYLVSRGVEGLPAGAAWHYDAPAHALSHLGSIGDATLCAMLGVTEDQLPQLVMLGVASTDKTQKKYNTFAFRFAHLDAGVTRAYLMHLAAQMCLPMRDYAGLRDLAATEALGVATLGAPNLACFAAGFGTTGNPMRAAYPALRRSQQVTQLAELAAHLPDPAGPARPLLAPPDRLARDHTRLMLSRRSVREFSGQPVDPATLSRLLAEARALDSALTASGALPVETALWAAVPDAGDGQGGLWLLAEGPDGGGLVCRRSGLPRDLLAQGMMQQSLSHAPLTVLITGRFHQAVDAWGARGYRELIGRAGAQVAALLLAAGRIGMAGCPWGGISESGWGPLLGIDRYTDCPLFGVALGWPEPGALSDDGEGPRHV